MRLNSSSLDSIRLQTSSPGRIYTSDGRVHYGPRTDYNGWSIEAREVEAGDIEEVRLGDRFIQFGAYWRIGEVDANYFAISHIDGQTPIRFRRSGTMYAGPQTGWNLRGRKHVGGAMGVTFGDRFAQIGDFRVGDVNGRYFSIAHAIEEKTAIIFEDNGRNWPGNGNRRDWTTVGRPLHDCRALPERPARFGFGSLYAFYNPFHNRYLRLRLDGTSGH